MLPSIEDLFAAERNFLREKMSLPVSGSDWHLNDDTHFVPQLRINRNPNASNIASSEYLFADSRSVEKEIILSYLKKHELSEINGSSISIFHNSTSAIFSFLLSKAERFRSRVLINGPFYFSIYSAVEMLSVQPVMYRHLLEDGFKLDIDRYLDTVDDQSIDISIITDPIYCTGTSNINQVIELLPQLEERGVLTLIDGSAGGFRQDGKHHLLNTQYAKYCANSKFCFYIDSPTKRLLLNSEKHALVFGDNETLEHVEGFSDHFSGSFSRQQIHTLHDIFSDEFRGETTKAANQNATAIASHDDLLSALIMTEENVVRAERLEGLYATIANPHLCQAEVDPIQVYQHLMDHYNIRLIPGCYFGFSDRDKITFRLNLFRKPEVFQNAIRAISQLHIHFGKSR